MYPLLSPSFLVCPPVSVDHAIVCLRACLSVLHCFNVCLYLFVTLCLHVLYYSMFYVYVCVHYSMYASLHVFFCKSLCVHVCLYVFIHCFVGMYVCVHFVFVSYISMSPLFYVFFSVCLSLLCVCLCVWTCLYVLPVCIHHSVCGTVRYSILCDVFFIHCSVCIYSLPSLCKYLYGCNTFSPCVCLCV